MTIIKIIINNDFIKSLVLTDNVYTLELIEDFKKIISQCNPYYYEFLLLADSNKNIVSNSYDLEYVEEQVTTGENIKLTPGMKLSIIDNGTMLDTMLTSKVIKGSVKLYNTLFFNIVFRIEGNQKELVEDFLKSYGYNF